MLKYLLAALALAVAVILLLASQRPDGFHVSRSLTINTSADKIFPHVNNQKAWQAWSPWTKADPNGKFTYSGPDAGVGSTVRWEGNMQLGVGTSTITESVKDERIVFALDFEKPMKANNTATFDFKTSGNATIVTWSMDGKNNFMGKVIGLLMDCEKMVGEQFDTGLQNLKTVAEK